jgi:endonuclease/exonuclease/phosphatase family metal-dependent hydrolase
MLDAFRLCKGFGVDSPSWFWKNRGATGGFRLDHIFVSPSIGVQACDYVHEWRLQSLSDHSGIYADITLP